MYFSFLSVIFKHRVLVKARLGHNFFMDIQKFKDESEDYVSYIWHHVAKTCKSSREQLACYMNAVDALKVCKADISIDMSVLKFQGTHRP